MPDPLSISSGAAGFVSLAITVCQGLVTYYKAWDAWEDDIQSAVLDVEDILKFLNLLSVRIGKLSSRQADIASQAQVETGHVVEAVTKLQQIQDKCKAIPAQNGERHRLHNFSRRSLYPFKRETLQELQNAARQARGGLSDLFQLLQIDLKEDTEILRTDVIKLHSDTQVITQTVTSIQPDIAKISQSTTTTETNVESLVQETKEVHAHVEVIRRDVNQLNTGLATDLASLREQLSRMESVQIAQTKIVASLSTTRGSVFLGSSQADAATSSHAGPVVDDLVASNVTGPQNQALHTQKLSNRLCSCRKRTVRYETNYTFGWLRFLASSENILVHSKSCPFWNPATEIQSKELGVAYIRPVFGKAVTMALKATRGAGGLSISPLLTLRGFVRETSPVFDLFYHPTLQLDLGSPEIYLNYASTRMLQHFSEGSASPFDRNMAGFTILREAVHRVRREWYGTEGFQRFLLTCIEAMVPLNEADFTLNLTPLEVFVKNASQEDSHESHISPITHLALTLHERGCDFGLSSTKYFLPRQLQFAFHLAGWAEVTECGPLGTAIIQRDEDKVLNILDHDRSAIHELNCLGQSPLHLSAVWSRGIEILLVHGAQQLVNKRDKDGYLPLEYALINRNYNASKSLIDAGSPLSSCTQIVDIHGKSILEHVCTPWEQQPKFFALVVEALESRRRRLHEFSRDHLPSRVWNELELPGNPVLDSNAVRVQRALEDCNIEIPPALCVHKHETTVYHTSQLCPLTAVDAEHLFQRGFRDIDAANLEGVTPFEYACLQRHDFTDGLAFIAWLVSKGADPYRLTAKLHSLKSVHGTSGCHFMGQFVSRSFFRWISPTDFRQLRAAKFGKVVDFLSEPSEKLFLETIRHRGRDACRCHCSRLGCSPVVIMQKEYSRYFEWRFRHHCNVFLITFIEQVERQTPGGQIVWDPSVAADAIRFETFETLGVLHTCCKWGGEDNPFIPRYEPEEIAEIHEEQSEVIEELEQLVCSFVQKYEELGESLSSFLSGYWRKRMAQVLTYRRPGGNAERARIRDIGVVIESESDEDDRKSIGDVNELKEGLDPGEIHNSEDGKLLNEDGADQIHSHGDDIHSVSKGSADEQPEPDIISESHLCSASSSPNKPISDKEWLRILRKYGPYLDNWSDEDDWSDDDD